MLRMLSVVMLAFGVNAHAGEWEENQGVADLFTQAGVQGTFVVLDVSGGRLIGHDHNRANTRFVPASTFKIPHSLIGLSVGAVTGLDEVVPYGGQPQPFEQWERDMSLREAITLSSVPIYQELARRIGPQRMNDQLSSLDYGNQDIGTTMDAFWLEGPLAISAIEQTQFLAKLALGKLPSAQDIQADVREAVLLERHPQWELYGKTGWENAPGAGIGWWVGWVKTNDRVYAFALNIDVAQASDAAKRVELGRASLEALDIIRPD